VGLGTALHEGAELWNCLLWGVQDVKAGLEELVVQESQLSAQLNTVRTPPPLNPNRLA